MLQAQSEPGPLSAIRLAYTWIKAIILSMVAFIPLFMINLPQGILWLTRPFAPRVADWSGRFFADKYWSYVVWLLETVYNLQVDIECEPAQIPIGETIIIVANHQSYVDPLVLLAVSRRYKAIGDLRFFVKDGLKFVPGPGWGMYFIDCIFLKRNWQQDAAHMQIFFDRYKKKKYPTWIHIFPEGTRRTLKKQEATVAYAKEKGRPPLKHVLWPRTKGFTATIEGMGSHLQAVYDLTIMYPENKAPGLWGVFLGNFRHLKVKLTRYPIADLPPTAEERSRWMVDLFYKKDALLEQSSSK